MPENKQKTGEVLWRWPKHTTILFIILQPGIFLGAFILWMGSINFDFSIINNYLIVYEEKQSFFHLLNYFWSHSSFYFYFYVFISMTISLILINGGFLFFLKHFLLRFIYFKNGQIPWDLASFWEYFTRKTIVGKEENSNIFFQKIGFSYRFIHRDLRKYIEQNPPDNFKFLDG